MKSIANNFENPDVNKLLIKHFKELRSVSPKGSTHVLDIDGLRKPSIKFWSLWQQDKLVGCGAIKLLSNDHGEFKSIRIVDEFKRKGLGKKIIGHLIEKAKLNNLKKISVETGAGEFFKPARILFKKTGFKECKPFAHYKEDINSVYFDIEI